MQLMSLTIVLLVAVPLAARADQTTEPEAGTCISSRSVAAASGGA
jgi:hypothetical protein